MDELYVGRHRAELPALAPVVPGQSHIDGYPMGAPNRVTQALEYVRTPDGDAPTIRFRRFDAPLPIDPLPVGPWLTARRARPGRGAGAVAVTDRVGDRVLRPAV